MGVVRQPGSALVSAALEARLQINAPGTGDFSQGLFISHCPKECPPIRRACRSRPPGPQEWHLGPAGPGLQAPPVSPPLQVLSQLEACGLVETIHISAAGFPIRVSHRNFVERYELLRRLRPGTAPSQSADEGRSERSPRAEQATLQALFQDILHTLPALAQAAATPGDRAEATPAPVHCGRTKVFMTDSTLELLERGRAQVLEQCARCIQGGWRRHQRRKQERQRQAAVLIQAAIRSWLTRKHIQRLHAAATVIKRAWQKWRVSVDS